MWPVTSQTEKNFFYLNSRVVL